MYNLRLFLRVAPKIKIDFVKNQLCVRFSVFSYFFSAGAFQLLKIINFSTKKDTEVENLRIFSALKVDD